MSLRELIDQLVDAGRNPKKTIARSIRDTGKEAIGCFPIYLPEEIIYASGLLPVGMWGGTKVPLERVDKYVAGFGCSIMRTNMELAMKGEYDFLKAIVIPTYCDTMKSILANWSLAVTEPPVITYTVLQNRQSRGAFDFMMSQNLKLKRALETLTGREITDEAVEAAFAIYERYRSTMREFTDLVSSYPQTLTPTVRHLILKAAWFMDKSEYTLELQELIAALKDTPAEQPTDVRVIVTGLMMEPESILDAMTASGYTIVNDDLAHESRQFRTLARQEGTAMERIIYRIIDLRGDTFFYEENKSRGSRLIQAVKDYKADGVIACLYKFCDPEEFDYPVYKKELEDAGVPLLYIEIDQQADASEQVKTRLQSFAEMLQM